MYEQKYCIDCRAPFLARMKWIGMSDDHHCAVCERSHALLDEQRRANAIAQQMLAMQAEEAAERRQRAAERRERMEQLEREVKRQERIERESSIPNSDAYKMAGFIPYPVSKLDIHVDEYGELHWNYYKPYLLVRLNKAYAQGIDDFMKKYSGPGQEYMLNQAYLAGKQLAAGTLPSRFHLNTNTVITSALDTDKVYTEEFTCNITSTIDENTGEFRFKYTRPFSLPEMNESFENGIREIQEEKNAPVLKKARRDEFRAEKHLKYYTNFGGAFVLACLIAAVFI